MQTRAWLALLAAVAVAAAGCFVPPANQPPTVSARASVVDAAVGQEIIFTGVAVDPDGSVARYEWDFDGDGVADFINSTRAVVAYAYRAPGTYRATFTAFDDRDAKGQAAVNLSIVARFVISTDWGASHGYTIRKAASLNASGLRVSAMPAGAGAPTNFTVGSGLEVVNDTLLRVELPAATLERYGSTRVEVYYNGTLSAERVVRAVPFMGAENDTATRYQAAIHETRLLADSNLTLDYQGTLDMRVVGAIVSTAFSGSGNSTGQSSEGGGSSTSTYAFDSVRWNQSFGRHLPSQSTLDFAWSATGTLDAVSESGFTTRVNLTRYDGARVLGNLTYERAEGSGYYVGDLAGSFGNANYELEGSQRLVVLNGNGVSTDVLRIFENLTLNGTYGGAAFDEVNRTERLTAVSDGYWHTDVSMAWNTTGHIGTTNLSDAGGRYLDSDGDGTFNPDSRPRFVSDGQNFFGLAPADLQEGDGFIVRNSGDATARIVVGPPSTEVLDAIGFPIVPIQVVHLAATVEAALAPWELPGSLSYSVVAAGPHAGLRISSLERLSYQGQSFEKALTLVGTAP